MTFDTVKELFSDLPYDKQMEVVDFIHFLSAESKKNEMKPSKIKFPFDIFKGGLLFISDDFDEIPEGFEDYI